MERIIHRQLVHALDSHNLLNDCQFGFRCNHSTVSLLLQAVNDWAGSLDRRNSTGPAEQVRQTWQLPNQSYRNPQFKDFHCLLDTLIVLAN